MSRLRIGTRESPLARWQASRVAALLRERFPGLDAEIVPMTTTGDRIRERTLAQAGGKGLFLKEIEEALLDGRVDLAVHSLKDVPADLVEGCALGAVLERAEPRDALCLPAAPGPDGRSGRTAATAGDVLAVLPEGARVGTGSLRRRTQLLDRRPDLDVVPIRGNVDTRLEKLDAGGWDALVLALAGLQRLGLTGGRSHRALDPDTMIPAPGQGALCVEIRDGDDEVARRVGALEDAGVRAATDAERAFLRAAGGTCKVPLGAHATLDDGGVWLRGILGDADGDVVRGSLGGALDDAGRIGAELARRLLDAGGAERLSRVEGWEAGRGIPEEPGTSGG